MHRQTHRRMTTNHLQGVLKKKTNEIHLLMHRESLSGKYAFHSTNQIAFSRVLVGEQESPHNYTNYTEEPWSHPKALNPASPKTPIPLKPPKVARPGDQCHR